MGDENTDKKDRIMGRGSGGGFGAKTYLLIVGVVALLAVGYLLTGGSLAGFSLSGGGGAASAVVAASAPSVQPQDYSNVRVDMEQVTASVGDGKVSFALSDLVANRLVYFDYKTSAGKSVPMMAYISPSGKVITAVRMCEPCRSTTFFIQNNKMVCGRCGTVWELETLRGISGGCLNYPPDALPNTISGERVYVEAARIENWKPRV
ncbi:MAG: Fe-S-containing protein [Candidatus Micrarchaeota archaeon]